MKPVRFYVPGSLLVERQLRREGPSPVFVAWKPHTSMLFTERKPLLKFCAWPASTETGKELRTWLDSFTESAKPQLDMEQIKATGWGPEAHEEDPTTNTKTII